MLDDLFSERHGYTSFGDEVQVESLNQRTRNKIWNLVNHKLVEYKTRAYGSGYKYENDFYRFAAFYWEDYKGRALDELPSPPDFADEIKNFFQSEEWFEVFNILRVSYESIGSPIEREKYINTINKTFEKENVQYRVVGGKITRITDDEEIEEVEKSLQSPFEGVRRHIDEAIELISDKQNPQYRNSIKESISAVESLCKIIADDENASLGIALDIVEEQVDLHGALRSGFGSLYGWTSQEDGIRHAMMEKPNVDFHDAKYMLVTCSAFINYLTGKVEPGA
jgi:hypothetical protein